MVRSLYMERLPYIDAYGVEVPAGADATWKALLRVARGSFSGTGEHWVGRLLGLSPASAQGAWAPDMQPGVALPGFEVDDVRRGELLSLRGGHRFSRYRLDFEVVEAGDGRPGELGPGPRPHLRPAGAAYRALVIGSGGHRVVVRRMLGRVARLAA